MGAHAVATQAFRIEGAGEPLPHELARSWRSPTRRS